MKYLIVGLGNIGAEYDNTRHNVGFEILDELAASREVSFKNDQLGAIAEFKFKGRTFILLKPNTYMNLSGKSVLAAQNFYKVSAAEDLLVICDDLNLDVGKIRIRARGSAGGQNGIKDIIHRLGTQDFSRLRVGIGRPPPRWDTANYVLGKFDDDDRPVMDIAIKKAADAVECWVGSGVQVAMNKFNAGPPKKKKKPSEKPDAEAETLNKDITKNDTKI